LRQDELDDAPEAEGIAATLALSLHIRLFTLKGLQAAAEFLHPF
jgi:hypothetical protein